MTIILKGDKQNEWVTILFLFSYKNVDLVDRQVHTQKNLNIQTLKAKKKKEKKNHNLWSRVSSFLHFKVLISSCFIRYILWPTGGARPQVWNSCPTVWKVGYTSISNTKIQLMHCCICWNLIIIRTFIDMALLNVTKCFT